MRGIGPERTGILGYRNMKKVIARQSGMDARNQTKGTMDALLAQHGLKSTGNPSTDLGLIRKFAKAMPGPNTGLKSQIMDYINKRRTLRQEVSSKVFDKALSTAIDEAAKEGRNIHMSATPKGGEFSGVVHPPISQLGFHGNMVTSTPGLGEFLKKQGAEPEMAEGFAAATQLINKLSRMAIISNPIVHVIWNLNGQYLGARGTGKDLIDIWNLKGWHPSAAEIKEAADHGALAHFAPQAKGMFGLGEGKMMQPYATLSTPEKLDKFGTSLWNWQQNFVFETMETRFAVKLFQQFKRGGLSADEAGLRVRKVLGDYANVSNTGLEADLNKNMFFYPWLKTLIPFWFKAIGNHPQALTAPYEAIRTNNELSNDPNLDRENPYAIHMGMGGENYFTSPLPGKIAEQVGGIFAPRGDVIGDATDATDRLRSLNSILENHATPAWDALQPFETMLEPAQAPGGPEHTLFDKDAPPLDQAGQIIQNALYTVAPIPPGVRSMVDEAGEALKGERSFTSPGSVQDLSESAFSALAGGSHFNRPSKGTAKAVSGLRFKLDKLHRQAEQAGALNSTWYHDAERRILEAIDDLQKRDNDK
jgi:hypothetical protein